MSYLGVLGSNFEKQLTLGPKVLDLGAFRLEFENNIVIFET